MNHEARHTTLEHLLPELFTPDELRRWIRTLPDGDRMLGLLSDRNVGSAQFVYETVDLISRYRLLGELSCWISLRDAAPTFLKSSVVELAKEFDVVITIPTSAPPGLPPDEETVTVLLISALLPEESSTLADSEFRSIIDKVRGTRARDIFRFITHQADSFDDLQTAILEHRPQILHITGLSDVHGTLRFRPSDFDSGIVSKERMWRNLRALNDGAALQDRIRMVVINACHSYSLAEGIPPTIDLAIGMHSTAANATSIGFATSFYRALGHGRTVSNSFDIALTAFEEGSSELPQLFPLPKNDAEKKRELKFVTTTTAPTPRPASAAKSSA